MKTIEFWLNTKKGRIESQFDLKGKCRHNVSAPTKMINYPPTIKGMCVVWLNEEIQKFWFTQLTMDLMILHKSSITKG